jgi:hypothetical protein
MKHPLLIFVCVLPLFIGCGKKQSDNPSDGNGSKPVNGSYGEAGRSMGVPSDRDTPETNLLTSPSNELHRVAK